MPGIEDLLGAGSIARQFFVWGVAMNIVSELLRPYTQALANDVQSAHQTVPLSPAMLADMVLRSIVGAEFGVTEAKKSGISPELFDLMVKNVGEPPALQEMLQLVRRDVMHLAGSGADSIAFEQAVKESRVKDKYIPLLGAARWVPLSFAEVIDALVENQIDEDTAKRIAYWNGVASDTYNAGTVEQLPGAPADPAGSLDQFTIARNTRGRPVSPTEAAELVHRGVIPVHGTGPQALTFEQAIFESAVKDKWEAPLESLITTIPSAYQILTLANAGVLPPDIEHRLLEWHGFDPEVIAAFLAHSSGAKTAGSKTLTQATILRLYEDQAIDNPTAAGYLEKLGYSATDAAFVLSVTDLQRELASVNAAVTKVRAQYQAHKIDRPVALATLQQLHIPAGQITTLLDIWDAELAVEVKRLTESQIVDAWEYAIIDQATATAELQTIGYDALDAWTLLSIKNKGPLPDRPG